MRSYQETIDFLYSRLPMFQRVGPAAYKKDLTNITAICEALGNPQNTFKSIHIAGTNGKGSVAHLLYVYLMESGFKCGISTSPHYKDFRERIKVAGAYIPEDYVIEFVSVHEHLIETIQPSFFELCTALAFDYFRSEHIEWAIIETGLGGRLDSTNIIMPELSIITNISMDHQSMLGNTLPEIAAEKAGIIKREVPVIIGERQAEVSSVFAEKAASLQCPLHWASDRYNAEFQGYSGNGMQIDLFNNGDLFAQNQFTQLSGTYQLRNIATFLQATEILHSQHHILVKKETIAQTLARVKSTGQLYGRMDIIDQDPLIILDSAHNEAGLNYLFEELHKFKKKQWHVVFGTVNDKDMGTIWPLLPAQAKYYFAKADVPRGLSADILAKEASAHGLQGIAYESVAKALDAAKNAANPGDLLVVCGSIFVAAEVLP